VATAIKPSGSACRQGDASLPRYAPAWHSKSLGGRCCAPIHRRNWPFSETSMASGGELRRASRSSSAGLTAQSWRVATGNRSSRPCCTALPTTRIGRFNWDCRGISSPIDLSRLLPEVFDRASQQKSLHAPGKFGIEAIAQAIPHQINGQHSYGYKKAREENNLEGQLDIGTAFSHDIPPTGDIRGSPCTQEAEVGLDNDRRGANISGLHQYWRQRIGHDMAE
jgi:hypothetical protein